MHSTNEKYFVDIVWMSDNNRSNFSWTNTTICCFYFIPRTIEQTSRILKAIPIHCFGKAITIPFATMFNIWLAARCHFFCVFVVAVVRFQKYFIHTFFTVTHEPQHILLFAAFHWNVLAIDSFKLFIYFFECFQKRIAVYSSNVVGTIKNMFISLIWSVVHDVGT